MKSIKTFEQFNLNENHNIIDRIIQEIELWQDDSGQFSNEKMKEIAMNLYGNGLDLDSLDDVNGCFFDDGIFGVFDEDGNTIASTKVETD